MDKAQQQTHLKSSPVCPITSYISGRWENQHINSHIRFSHPHPNVLAVIFRMKRVGELKYTVRFLLTASSLLSFLQKEAEEMEEDEDMMHNFTSKVCLSGDHFDPD